MSSSCPRVSDLTRWLAGDPAVLDADALRRHVVACSVCQDVLSKAAPAALIAQIAASEHIDSIALSEYADGALSSARRQIVDSHILQCPECGARLVRLLEGRELPSRGVASHIVSTHKSDGSRLSRWLQDAAIVATVALVVVVTWWFLGEIRLLDRDAKVGVAVPPALLRDLPADRRAVMEALCRNLASTGPIPSKEPAHRYRGARSSTPQVEIVYPLPMDVLPYRELVIMVRTPGDLVASVEVFDKETGAAVGSWVIPSGRLIRVPGKFDYGRTYTIVANLKSDPGLRSEDRLFSVAAEPLAEEVGRLSERCQGDALLLGALYETYGMYGAADRHYATASESPTRQTRGRDVYEAWRKRSGLERLR